MSFAEVTFAVSSSSHSLQWGDFFRRALAIRGNRAHNQKCLPAARGTKYLRRTWGRGGFAAGALPGPSFLRARSAHRSECPRTRHEVALTPWFTGRVLERITKRILGGSDGNEQLTAIVATLLLVLLAVEGATLLNIRSLLTVHAFVGVLLIPVVAVKLGSTGWRMVRYYLGADEYVRRGPPQIVLRAIVAPVLVVSTTALFGSGVGLLVLAQREGALVGLHKASFLIWFGATTVHVLTRILSLPRAIRLPSPGLALRLGIVAASLVTGLALATVSLPAVDGLQDGVSAHIGVDPQ